MLLVGTQGSQVVQRHAPVTSSDTMNRRSFSGHRCWKFEVLNMYATSGMAGHGDAPSVMASTTWPTYTPHQQWPQGPRSELCTSQG